MPLLNGATNLPPASLAPWLAPQLEFGLWNRVNAEFGVHLIEPVGYVDFMSLVFNARYVLTDSGGLQEETTYLRIPCLTLRKNTERPVTVTEGTNRLINLSDVLRSIDAILAQGTVSGRIPDRWDGKTAGRVVKSLRAQVERNII